MNALHTLLAAIVDYAGLFPPAGLNMAQAVRNYAQHHASDDAWMLGRFVVPVGRLGEFAAARAAVRDGAAWHLSGLLGEDVARDVERATEFNARSSRGGTVDALEVRITSPDDVATLARLPVEGFSIFGELPWGADPGPMIAALRRAGFNAKIRTGGVTEDSIPEPRSLIRVMRACIEAGVAFKATAGLHHPIRGPYRLTYADSAPTGVMYGYLNLFLAAAGLTQSMSDDDAVALLTEQQAGAFALSEDGIRWRDRTLDTASLGATRDRVAASFGSCSFREPVDELRELALLA